MDCVNTASGEEKVGTRHKLTTKGSFIYYVSNFRRGGDPKAEKTAESCPRV